MKTLLMVRFQFRWRIIPYISAIFRSLSAINGKLIGAPLKLPQTSAMSLSQLLCSDTVSTDKPINYSFFYQILASEQQFEKAQCCILV